MHDSMQGATEPLFSGVYLGGFECSCHMLQDGTRLDLTASTRHDVFASADYARLKAMGMTAARDSVQWTKVDHAGRDLDFSSVAPMVAAAKEHRVQVIWDLLHFGWSRDVDLFSGAMPGRFGRYAGKFAKWLAAQSDAPVMIAAVNEMSFLAWAGGDVQVMNPFQASRGVELKAQLVRATIEAIEAIRSVIPGARFVQPEPVIKIHKNPAHPRSFARVESDNLLQYQTWDMLAGNVWPSLGGKPSYLDIIGVNYYPDNQFTPEGDTVSRFDPRYRPFEEILREVWQRYKRPMFVSETGSEGDARASWLTYVCEQSIAAMRAGVQLHGITLYPVLNHEGWGDNRHCENGLWDYADEKGRRAVHAPLAVALEYWAPRLHAARQRVLAGPVRPVAMSAGFAQLSGA